jgi:hypothetical protein
MRCRLLFLSIAVVGLACGCEGTLENRVVLEGGRLSIVPPEGWVVEEEERGSATVIAGPGGRLSVALMDSVPSVPEHRDLLAALGAVSPGFRVRREEDFAAEAVMGKEFIVSYAGEADARGGAVYVFGKEGKLCILTFSAGSSEVEERLDGFRAAAGSLRFLTVQ